MPREAREVTAADIIPDAEFAQQRSARRAALLPKKQLRRVPLGPHCTFYFECFETMLFQIQEMLLIEKGGAEQLKDELAAYNPLIPRGGELVATMMFEIDDPVRRARILGGLGGVEEHFFIEAAGEKVRGIPEGDVERSREDGKTSSVHFLRFAFTPQQTAAFRDMASPVILGCDDPRYPHQTTLGASAREELEKDF
jgi:hypothetical protein